MDSRIKRGFEQVKADEKLKLNTVNYIRKQTENRKGKMANHILKLSAIPAFCLIIFVMGLGGYSVYATETAYISIDVNPSIELGLNRFDRVISLDSFNGEGEEIVQALDVKNKKYQQAVEEILQNPKFADYLEAEQELNVTVAAEDKLRQQDILEGVQHCGNAVGVQAHCKNGEAANIETAHGCGMSLGKYELYLEAKNCDVGITENDCKQLSMREIRERMDACTEHGRRGQNKMQQEEGGGKHRHHGEGHE